MSIVKLNNRSVKDITAFGSISSLGSLTHIATQTASSSASISFTSGIDSTYKEYIFYFVNMHAGASGNNNLFSVNMSTDSGSNYNVVKTTTNIEIYHAESGSASGVGYVSSKDLAQGTGIQYLSAEIGSGNDECCSGFLHLFNPSSTTFVKHYITRFVSEGASEQMSDSFVSGYCNTTSAIDAVQFTYNSGNIDSGQILLFGLN